MNIARFFAMSELVLVGHVLNFHFFNRVARRKVRTNATARIVTKYFKRYLPAVKSVPETDVVHDDKNDKIWTLWLQGEEKAPALVKACFRSVRRHCKQELVVLDAKTVFDYITLPAEIVVVIGWILLVL